MWVTAAVGLVVCGAAVAAASVTYRAGRSQPPYVTVTDANRQVVKVRWAFLEPCDEAYPWQASATNTVRARIGARVHFAKTISYMDGDADVTTSFSGMITSRVATITIHDEESIPHDGFCHGSHTFKARKT